VVVYIRAKCFKVRSHVNARSEKAPSDLVTWKTFLMDEHRIGLVLDFVMVKII